MKKLLIAFGLLLITNPAFANFTDVSSTSPYAQAINWAEETNIVQGFSDGTFKPEQQINRAELTKIIIEANFDNSEIYGENCFSDVHNEWFAKYICTAQRKKIIKGYADGSFKPAQNVSFVEAAKIILLGMGENITENSTVWYTNYTQYLSQQLAIPTSIQSVNSNLTRGEMVEIIWRLRTHNLNQPSKSMADEALLDQSNPQILDYEYLLNKKYLSDGKNQEEQYFLALKYGYVLKNNQMYKKERLIENADIASFQVINELFAKDKSHVYKDYAQLPEADPATFYAIDGIYSKDQNHCYKHYEIVPISECNTIIR